MRHGPTSLDPQAVAVPSLRINKVQCFCHRFVSIKYGRTYPGKLAGRRKTMAVLSILVTSCNLNCTTPTTADPSESAYRPLECSELLDPTRASPMGYAQGLSQKHKSNLRQNGCGWHGGSRKYFAGRVRAAVCRHVGPKPSNKPPGHVAPA